MNSVGIASGGGAGMNLAHLIVHGHTPYDLSEADAKRFAPIYNSLDHLMARAPEILGTHYDIAYPGKQLSTARNLRTCPCMRFMSMLARILVSFMDGNAHSTSGKPKNRYDI